MKQIEIVIEQDYRQPLSFASLADYRRLFTWLYWRPQALRAYIHLHAVDPASTAWRVLEAMTAVIWAAALVVGGLSGWIVLLLTHQSSLLGLDRAFYFAPAILLSLFSLLLTLVMLQIYDERDTRYGYGTRCTRLLIWPTIGLYAVYMAFGYLRILQIGQITAIDAVLLYGGMGAFSGLLYSQVAAYQRSGMPQWLFIAVVGLLLSLPAAGAAAIVGLLLPAWDPEISLAQRLLLGLVALLLSYMLFMTVTTRIDNWLYAWLRTRVPLVWQRFTNVTFPSSTSTGMVQLTKVYPPTISYLSFPEVSEALGDAQNEQWSDAVKKAATVWSYTWQHRKVAAFLHGQVDSTVQERQGERLALVTRRHWPWHGSPLLAHAGYQPPLAIMKNALLMYTPSDQTQKGNFEGFTSQGFILSEICKKAKTIEEAMAMIDDAAIDTKGLSPLKALGALRRLYGSNEIIGSREFKYDDNLLPRTGIPDSVKDKESWDVIDQMLSIFRYAWLVSRCQHADHRRKGVEAVCLLLDNQETHVRNTEAIDDCVRKFVVQVIDKWRSDMRIVIDDGEHFKVQKYELPEDLLEKGDAAGEQTAKRRNRKRDKMQPNPYDYDEPVRKRDRLKSRDRAMDALRDAWNEEHLQVVEITAPVLCGSTSLFLAIADKYKIQNKDVEFAYLSIGHLTSDAKELEKLANGLFDVLSVRTQGLQVNASFAGESVRRLENIIRFICRDSHRLVVAFDDIDHLERVLEGKGSLQRFMEFIFHLNEIIPNFGVVLIGTIDRADEYRRLRSHTTRFAKPIVLGPIGSRNDVEQLLNAPTDTFLPRFTPNAIDHLLELSGGVPYLVQLLAWNVYEQFQSRYEFPDPKLKPGSEGFVHDPLFTEEAVSAVLAAPTFRLGWRYYVHRLERYFGPRDWEYARQILDRFTNEKVMKVRAGDFKSTVPDPSGLDEKRAQDLLVRLKTQCVLNRSSLGEYSLRIGLMDPMLRETWGIDDDDEPLEGN